MFVHSLTETFFSYGPRFHDKVKKTYDLNKIVLMMHRKTPLQTAKKTAGCTMNGCIRGQREDRFMSNGRVYRARPDFIDAVSIVTEDAFATLASTVETLTQLEAVSVILRAVKHSSFSSELRSGVSC